MNRTTFDVAVVGLGAMGSSAVYHLARRGLSVLGIDQFNPPHDQGSSHGETRIIREAYFEDPIYVPIVQRAYELWEQLEAYSERNLFLKTGGLMIGHPDSELITGSEYSARHHRLPYGRLTSEDIERSYPQYKVPEDNIAIWDARAGVLFPEACISALIDAAQKHDAQLLTDTTVTAWSAGPQGVIISTSEGTFQANQLVLAAGAWIPSLCKSNSLNLPLTVERQVLFWYEPKTQIEDFSSEQCPIFVWETEPDTHFYGFPNFGSGVKVARMHHGQSTSPNTISRDVTPEDQAPVDAFMNEFIPGAYGRKLRSQVCMFTNTPDLNFIIDNHPQHENVIIASPCSGHGFKFASAIGEIIADMAVEGESQYDLRAFSLERFSS